jgi:hypothetical protein
MKEQRNMPAIKSKKRLSLFFLRNSKAMMLPIKKIKPIIRIKK